MRSRLCIRRHSLGRHRMHLEKLEQEVAADTTTVAGPAELRAVPSSLVDVALIQWRLPILAVLNLVIYQKDCRISAETHQNGRCWCKRL